MTALRPWRAFGLRGRIIGVVLVTAVATLGVAAVALLGPLEQSLRNAEKTTLKRNLGARTIRTFSGLRLDHLVTDPRVVAKLENAQGRLATRLGATVNVFGFPGANGTVTGPLIRPRDGTDDDDAFDDVAVAFRRGTDYSFGSLDGHPTARAAIRFWVSGLPFVLAVRKPIGDLPGAVHAVRMAFVYAAVAAMALSLMLGIPLSARLVRRLQRLREAAILLPSGDPAVQVPDDPAHDEVGDLARTLATMQLRLSRQEEARRAFVATASHELRTPLTSLDGMLELLSEDLRDEEPDLKDARALVARAHAQSRRLGRLAADLLDLSRIDAQVSLRSEPVELGELSRAVLAEFEIGTEQHAVRSSIAEPGGSVWALGDPGSIAQILRILLDNAVRASPKGAEVRVRLHAGEPVAISVADDGPGVAPDERESIFERFHRGRAAAGQAGFGLGLAIGRELAERMGGELVLEESGPPGATFTLHLPSSVTPEHETLSVA